MSVVSTSILPRDDMSQHRIKRKPVPTLDINERYPPLDPNDPFAPLWVLRNRSSALLTSQEDLPSLSSRRASFMLYPSPPTGSPLSYVSDKDIVSPLASPSRSRPSHYRRRSQSIAVIPSSPSPTSSPLRQTDQISRPPSIIRDRSNHSHGSDSSFTDVEPDPLLPSVLQPSGSSRNKFTRLLVPKKGSINSLSSIARSCSPNPQQICKSSISSPIPIAAPAMLEFKGSGRCTPLLAALDDRCSPAHELIDPGYQSQPEPTRCRSPSVFTTTRGTQRRAPSVIPIPSAHSSSHDASSYITVSTTPSLYNIPTSPSPKKYKLRRPTHAHARSPSAFKPQDEYAPPTYAQLAHAASLPLIASSGLRVPFGSLFTNIRTIVIFIRHFWCPLCQDYIDALVNLVTPEMLSPSSRIPASDSAPWNMSYSDDGLSPNKESKQVDENVQLVVIGNGAHTLIDKYRQMLGMRFDLYTDPGCDLFRALGMGTIVDVCGREIRQRADRQLKQHAGGYVKHGTVAGIAMVVVRALKAGMPVWEKGGEIGQLGGEFVFGPG